DQILRAEDGLKRVQDDLAQRRATVSKQEATSPKGSSSWLTNFVPSQRATDMRHAAQEIAGLEALEAQMKRNLAGLKQQQEEAKFSRTFNGRIFNFGGCLFAVYCVYRIFVSIVNLVLPSARSRVSDAPSDGDPRTDYITIFLAYLLSLMPKAHFKHDDIALISRQISLALVGVIILSSIRLVLRGVTKALRVTSRNLGASLMLLIVAQLMGIYLLSTLVQLRTSFPPPLLSHPDSDTPVVNLFSTLPEYQVFGAVFDSAFLLAAGLTALVRWFGQRINSVGVMDM
ncbi:Abscisic acid G-protein coupled receptor-domain-containing protein, partial [Cytidiella melzeri]